MSSFLSALQPYATNKNTGNVYEIAVALDLLNQMGLTEANMEEPENAALIQAIIQHNVKKQAEIRALFAEIKSESKSKSNHLIFDGHHVTNIICATQDDSVGTGDFQLVTPDGIKTLSVCEGQVKRNGNIEKCLTNPSARRFKCTDEDIEHFKQLEQATVASYKNYMTVRFGEEAAWPSRTRTPVAVDACAKVAAKTAQRFQTLTNSEKVAMFNDILRIDGTNRPADYLAIVPKSGKGTICYFKFGDLRTLVPTTGENPTLDLDLIADGIYLKFRINDRTVGSTQVKFNNGVYHKGKTSSIWSSWNATFVLSDLFNMTPIKGALPPLGTPKGASPP
jgi:hypothetical protein